MTVAVDLMVENLVQSKYGITIIVNLCLKFQKRIESAQESLLGILPCVFGIDKDCGIDKYLKNCTYLESFADNLVVHSVLLYYQ